MSAAPQPTIPVLEPVSKPVPAPGGSPEPRSPRWRVALILLVIVAGLAAWYGTRDPKVQAPVSGPVAVRTVAVSAGNLDNVVRITGQTAAINFANMTAPMLRGPDAGRDLILLEIAPPGSFVKKGAVVARIDAQSLIDHVDDLGDTIRAAEADIAKRQAEQAIEMERLRQTVRSTKAELDKLQIEYNGSETQTDIQRQLLKLSLEESEARHKQAIADVAEKQKAHLADVGILKYTLLRHTRHRDRHVKDIEVFTLRAPIDGLVVMQQLWRGGEMGQVQVGDRLSPGQPFMKIVDTSKMQVEANVNQAETSDFRIGQKAVVKLDAFPNTEFEGRIHSIGALAAGGFRNSYFVRTVPVRVSILGNDPKLIPDLSASADVVVASAASAASVPLAAVQNENGTHVVYVKNGQNFDRREVQTGFRTSTQVAIDSGVQPGEEVRLN